MIVMFYSAYGIDYNNFYMFILYKCQGENDQDRDQVQDQVQDHHQKVQVQVKVLENHLLCQKKRWHRV